ncbi:MAG: two-component regulator propeller domain-containing protein [Bacteroidia bacterium]|nr:two-component regulator propeller domain-containing protein [Bacteroidia bacterium]
MPLSPTRIYLLLFACFLLFIDVENIYSQNRKLEFEHISVEEGLSQGNVSCFLKDSYGYLWIGTQDGLNRYDGYEFTSFFHEPGNPKSLKSNYIWTVLEDREKNLWIGTFGGGLSKWDRKTEQFLNFLPEAGNPYGSLAHDGVRSLYLHQDSLLLIGTDYGLSILNTHTYQIKSWPHEPGTSRNFFARNILSMSPLKEGRFLLGHNNGLAVFDLENEKLEALNFTSEFLREDQIYFTSCILAESSQRYWIGTSIGLLLVVEDSNGKFRIEKYLQKENAAEQGLLSSSITSLFLDKYGTFWIGTAEGLNFGDIERLETEGAHILNRSSHDPNVLSSLSHNRTNAIMGDESGNLLLGTSYGINKTSINSPFFGKISFESSQRQLCNNKILGINQDKEGKLWVATVGGLSIFNSWDEIPGDLTCYHMEQELGTDYLLNVCRDRNDQMWLTTRRGGFAKVIVEGSGKLSFEHYTHDDKDPESLSANTVYTFYEDSKGRYWVGTALGGLNLFDPISGTFKHYLHNPEDSTGLPHPFVYSILEDRMGRFWIGTAGGGLCKMDPEKGTFTTYDSKGNLPGSLSNDMILSLHENQAGQLWIGTANGLCLMEKEGVFRSFFRKDGLPNDVIYGILEDEEGNLWLSTNNGISRTSWKEGEFKTRNFGIEDGLSNLEFNQFAYFKAQNGQMFFGGTHGLVYFHPDSLKLNKQLPKLQITGIKLFNQEVPVDPNPENQSAFHLPQSIRVTDEVKLSYDQDFLSFEFAALEYTKAEKNQFAYQLVGVDRDWVYSGKRRFADYPNLAPGTYTFRVKASNNDGLWNEEAKELQIHISPPPWKSWWAYALYALCFLGAIFLFISYRTQEVRQEMRTLARIERIKVEEREQLRARTSQDFHDEAGNNLTKLSLYTGLSKRSAQDNPDLQEYLQKMEENLQELGSGIRDFIWTLDPRHDSLHATLDRIRDFASSLFEHTDIEFHFDNQLQGDEEESLTLTTKRHLLLICKEALNNILKYADCSKVSIRVARKDQKLLLSLIDNGKGFHEKDLKRVNGLNNMRSRAKEMEAQLHIESQESQGTCIRLEKEIFKKEEARF